VVVAAARLAEWIGEDDVPVTLAGHFSPLMFPLPRQRWGCSPRRAADMPEVHRPWLTAVSAGLIAIAGNRAVQAGRLEDPLAAWWAGLQALLAAEAVDTIGVDPRITAMVTMDVVTSEHVDGGWGLQRRVGHVMYDRGDWDSLADPRRHGRLHPAEAALAPAGAAGRNRRGRRLEPGQPLVRRTHRGPDRG
jgi:hypothetical protein